MKKIIGLFMAGILVVSMTACADQENGTDRGLLMIKEETRL